MCAEKLMITYRDEHLLVCTDDQLHHHLQRRPLDEYVQGRALTGVQRGTLTGSSTYVSALHLRECIRLMITYRDEHLRVCIDDHLQRRSSNDHLQRRELTCVH